MSGISIEPNQESQLIINPMSDKNLCQQFSLWKNLTSSCYGPYGKNVSVQNVIGGHVSITKSSSRLFDLIRPSHPMTQLVVSAIKNHLKQYNDFGLFATTFVFELLEEYEKTNLSQSVKSIANEYFSNIILNHLLSPENNCCYLKVDPTSVSHLMSVVKSIFKSKLFIFSEAEIGFLSSLLLESFFSLIPSNLNENNVLKFGKLHSIHQEGVSVKHSKFYSGFLYCLTISQMPLTNFDLLNSKIVLFKVSLAGDSSLSDLTIEVNQQHAVKDCLLKMLFELAERLIKMQVKVVACQKVIHPKICKFLQNQNIVVMQRLGENGCNEISRLTNSTPIATINGENIQEKDFGVVGKTEYISTHGKNYIRFFGSAGTIILCQNNEENLKELSVVFQQGYQSLLLLLRNPNVFIGGSCLEFHLASIIDDEVNCSKINYTDLLGISKGQLTESLTAFTTVLRRMGLNLLKKEGVEPGTKVGCYCMCCSNMKIEPNSIVDVALSKLSAYKVAMETVSIMLKIGICIIDKN